MKLKTLLFLLLALLTSTTLQAYNAKINSIFYYFSGNEAIVTYGDYDYSGNIVIPESVTYSGRTYSVTTIDSYAFYNCTDLTSITIPSTLKRVKTGAFYGCTSLSKVIVKDIAAWCGIIYDGDDYNCDFPLGIAQHLYSDENTEITEVVIPEGVTRIEARAFRDAVGITSIAIPSSVTYIGQEAFRNMQSLISINLPQGITSIEPLIFDDCISLTTINIPEGVTIIKEKAFLNCYSLVSIKIPSTLKNVMKESFANCFSLAKVIVTDLVAWCGIIYEGDNSNNDGDFPLCRARHLYCDENTEITEVVIPEGVTRIEARAFRDAEYVTSLTIPNGVTYIGDEAFRGMRCLASIYIPNSVTTIGKNAFLDCSGLTNITLPNSNIGIGDYCFSGCYSMLDFYCYAESVPSIRSNAFNESNIEAATLHVPAVSIDSYRATWPWTSFFAIVAIGEDVNTEAIEIASAEELSNFAARVNAGENYLSAILKSDIDFTAYSNVMIGRNCFYRGEFDGAGHSIKLNLNRGSDNAALFGYLSGYVHNLTTIGTIKTSAKFAAGIAAHAINATIEQCQSRVNIVSTVNGDGTHGGIVGVSHAGTIIRDCLISGAITGSQTSCCAGVSGWAADGITYISNCLIRSQFGVGTTDSDLLSRNNNYVISSNNYFQGTWNAPNNCGDVTILTENQAKSGEACYRLNAGRIGDEMAWYQTLDEDDSPVPDNCHSVVYLYGHLHCDGTMYEDGATGYSNDSNTTITKDEHIFVDGYCSYCGIPDESHTLSVSTIIVNSETQPMYAGGYITNYSKESVIKKGIIVSKSAQDMVISNDTQFEIYPIDYPDIDPIDIPKDIRFIDCTTTNEEQFSCALKFLMGNTDYYIRAFVIDRNDNVLYGGIENIHTQNYNRYNGYAGYGNVWYAFQYTLFDLVTDEIIDPNDGFYYTTNENPTTVGYQTGTGYNTCYKIATEWNYRLWYYHSWWCDNTKIVSIPIMRYRNGKLEITKAKADADKDITIYYSINGDGTRPENFTQIYSEPLTVENNSIVYCYAISSDGYMSWTNRYAIRDCNNGSSYKSLDDYIATSETTYNTKEHNWYINPIIQNIKKVYVDLTKGTTNSMSCYLDIKNTQNPKEVVFSSKYLQSSTSTSDNIIIVDNNNNDKRYNLKKLVDEKTYPWLYYNPNNSNEVIIDIEEYFGCMGCIHNWQENFGTSCVVNIVTGSISTLTYIVDDEVYKTYELEYGSPITPEEEPTKEGYTFSGWSEIPETMPNHDVVITGSFYLYGDVNTDSEVDVVDVVDIARFVVGTPANTFKEVLADINNDGYVNLGDAVVLVNNIAGNQNFVKAWQASSNISTNDALSLSEIEGGLSLNLENERDYTAFQFDLFVPKNVAVSKMMLNAGRKQGHQLLYNRVEDGHYRIAALSTSNNEFNGNSGELLNIALNGVTGNEVSLRNIHFFDAEGHDYLFDDIESAITTSITSVLFKGDGGVFDLQGRMRTALQHGINIVGGKKVIVK